MFGWEFPPHIAGGLGTASYGLTKGLAKHGVKVMFVMPKAGGDEDQSVVKIINASDVEMMSEYSNLDEYWQNVNFMEIGSNLVPYLEFNKPSLILIITISSWNNAQITPPFCF